ncbi:MAG: hypothetical protein RM021_031365 [Nostoc sp. EkiNYC01]
MRGQPVVDNKTNISVEIKRQNIFSPDALKTIDDFPQHGEKYLWVE